ncbi:MAG: hypothetical protein ABSB26_08245 [Nitrososphaerales archaeon]
MAARTTYVIALALVALLIISTTAGVYYYYEYGQVTQSKDRYVSELTAAASQYDRLVSNYDSSLSLYNETFSLLVGTIAVVNTSLPMYQQASTELSQLWSRYLGLKPAPSSLYATDILIDFGNGTLHWYNNTEVQPGWNMYTAIVVLSHGDLQAQLYHLLSENEHFVSGIDGVSNSKTRFWFLWTYNETASWRTAQVGADDLPVYNGSVFAWTYCGETASYTPTCSP